MKKLEDKIFSIQSPEDFTSIALQIFQFQTKNNPIYKEYISYLGIEPKSVQKLIQIPFLPIEFFKNHEVYCGLLKPELEFHSSGTGNAGRSIHFVAKRTLYEKSFMANFSRFYGLPSDFCILALLPSYLEQNHSSLAYMADYLIKESMHPLSGFYLNNFEKLSEVLINLEKNKQKTILLGVSYALLDFGEQFRPCLENTIIMETGGMKGKRKEMLKVEFHETLMDLFGLKEIHSEYGMTELLSQSYSGNSYRYFSSPWKKVLIRDLYDPLKTTENSGRGGLNIIDLANLYSCSFIATQDLGSVFEDGSFEISGRFDNSDIRGCNLLIT